MGLFDLGEAEKKLCKNVWHGDKTIFEGNGEALIEADVLRHIIIGLPLVKRGSEEWAPYDPSSKEGGYGVACPRTGVGVHVKGARIAGRLKLDSAFSEDGGPICPLEFENCIFAEGISGRHSHFSRLSLIGCVFGDPQPERGGAVPTIDLSGATVGGDLGLVRIMPFGLGTRRHFLWIRAIGARIEGNLELSRSHLRAPEDNSKRLMEEPRIQPLDLSLATIEGDLLFLGGEVEGPVSARGAHIRGDVWLSGTRIERRPDDTMALFFQLARIGGGMMLDGRWDFADEEIKSSVAGNEFRPFCANGALNLFGVRVGGSIVMNDIQLESKDSKEGIVLTGARVADRIEVRSREKGKRAYIDGRIRLDRVEVGSFVSFEGVELGSTASGGPRCHCIDARSLVAKHVAIQPVVPESDGPHDLSITLAHATLEQLKIEGERINGALEASPLCCTGNVTLAGEFRCTVNLENADIGGTLDISGLKIEGKKARLSLRDATIGGALRLTLPESGADTGFVLDGEADLTGLSVDTLDDDIGRCWGKKAAIAMDHFTYRRTESRGDKEEFRQKSFRMVTDWLQSLMAELPWPPCLIPELAKEKKKKPAKDEAVAKDEKPAKGNEFRRPWQLRRNWIYRQFECHHARTASADRLVSITRHRIFEHEYRPQPFEQAIKVARAEGREDFATHFEMQKQRLEWRFVTRRVRWALGFVAIVLSSSWLLLNAPSAWAWRLTALAFAVTAALMLFGSSIRDSVWRPLVLLVRTSPRSWPILAAVEIWLFMLWRGHSGGMAAIFGVLAISIAMIAVVILGTRAAITLSKPRTRKGDMRETTPAEKEKEGTEDEDRMQDTTSKVLTWFVYWIPALSLIIWTYWSQKPFHYLVGFAIFAVIRLSAVSAHAVMRFGFGYMRRPTYAVATLILSFLLGWWGVSIANQRGMLVIDAQPVAPLAMPDNHAHYPEGHRDQKSTPVLMGSMRVAGGEGYARELSCGATISEPLYALDVLIPIIDLREERSCEIRRVAEPADEGEHGEAAPAHPRAAPDPGEMSFGELWAAVPGLALDDHRFWWWVKAIYAVLGWIIVSLSILTFAHVNKIHAEPPTEHK